MSDVRLRRASLHESLREATHDAHVRLNHHPALSGLTRPGYALGSYRRVLLTYEMAYGEMESAILAWLAEREEVFDYRSRCKQVWLRQDLTWFGDVPLKRTGDLPAAPQIASLGSLAGVLYPIEGSTLGGQVIAASLLRNLNLSSEAGARFFAGYGEATPARWDGFLAFLASLDLSPAEQESARLAARQTFAYLERMLDRFVPV